MRLGPRLQAAVVLLAAVVAFAPRPADVVEHVYATRLYPPLQAAVTTASNLVPLAIFDVVLSAALVSAVWIWGRALFATRRTRHLRPLLSALRLTLVAAATGYLWFVAIWGLNYARPPIDVRLALPAAAATSAEVLALLDLSIERANGLYDAARADHAVASDGAPNQTASDIAVALHAVEARQGRPRPTVPGRVKPTLLALYFRMAGVDGMTAPAALETLLNPDLTAFERPFVLAHEWAHLAGYAPEADANFVAWLTTMEPSAAPRTAYSGWLFLLSETAAQVPREARRASLLRLASGPRRDLDAIAERTRQQVEVVQRVGWRVYDQYLRSQGVQEGIVSYSRVVDLIARASRTTASGSAAPVPVPQ
ncbi:MAG: DUF3810 family protein [Acidobacteriota bacterium]